MGFKDYLRIAASEAAAAIREADNALSADPDYVAARDAVKRGASSAKRASLDAIAKAGESESGKRIGERSRQIGSAMSRTPVLSAVGDVLSQQAGLPQLLVLREERPDDGWPLLWLAEALRRLRRSRNTVLAVRAPFEPLSAVVAISARTTGALGVDDPIDRCERAAWSMAVRSLHDDPSRLDQAHILSRIYLARGFADQAIGLAAISAANPEGNGLSLVTLAHAHKQAGHEAKSLAAARQAVEEGCTVGYDVLANELISRRSYSEALDLLGRVTKSDRERYHGVAPSAEGVVRGALAAQRDKTREVVQ